MQGWIFHFLDDMFFLMTILPLYTLVCYLKFTILFLHHYTWSEVKWEIEWEISSPFTTTNTVRNHIHHLSLPLWFLRNFILPSLIYDLSAENHSFVKSSRSLSLYWVRRGNLEINLFPSQSPKPLWRNPYSLILFSRLTNEESPEQNSFYLKAFIDLFQQQAALSMSSVGGIGSDPSVAKDLGNRAMFLAHVTRFYRK